MPHIGRVKWYSGPKGYGFIECEDGQDIFVHRSAYKPGDSRELAEGDKVQFEIVVGPKGPQAADVVKI